MIVVVMGVASAGKTVVRQRLAAALDAGSSTPTTTTRQRAWRRYAGTPLTDADRWPWLAQLNGMLRGRIGGRSVCSCSALKAAYREALLEDLRTRHVLLRGAKPRSSRGGAARHYMNPGLLESQFAALEEPPRNVVDIGERRKRLCSGAQSNCSGK
jgi:gluconokinase